MKNCKAGVTVINDTAKLCRIVRSRSPAEGKTETELPFLSIYRSSDKTVNMPHEENFYFFVVLDGSVRLHTPSGIMDYMPGQYSVSKIDTPTSGHILTFSEAGDFISLAIELTLNEVISILLDLDGSFVEKIVKGQIDNETMTTSDNNVISSICRLFWIMKEPV